MINKILRNGTIEIDLSMENISIDKKLEIIKHLLKGEGVIEDENRTMHDKKKVL